MSDSDIKQILADFLCAYQKLRDDDTATAVFATAVQAIQALRQPKLEWLPITDELPEGVKNEFFVTGYRLDDPAKGRFIRVGYKQNGAWWNSGLSQLFTPTHYMPLGALPPVPKETPDADNSRTA